MRIIGLTGQAGSGKDTVRGILEQCHGFRGMAFADPIRSMLATLLCDAGVSPEWIYRRDLKEKPIPELGTSYRHLAQTLGTEWGRSFTQGDPWLRIAQARATALKACGVNRLVISDVRFPNEASWIRAQGGEIWRIERPNIPSVREHASEKLEHITPDRTIPNTDTVGALHSWVDALMWERAC